MADEPLVHASFELHDEYPQLELDGTVAELRTHFRTQVETEVPHEPLRSLGRTVWTIVAGVGAVGVLLVYVLALPMLVVLLQYDLPEVNGISGAVVVLVLMVVVFQGLARVPAPEHRPPPIDLRKWGMVEPLLAWLEREVPTGERVSLKVDFRSAINHPFEPILEPDFDGLGIAVPDSEPQHHVWLRLRAQLPGLELHMRVRTLIGRSGSTVLRLRDEIGVTLRGEGLSTTLETQPPAELRTALLGHELTPTCARLQFRGRGAARRELIHPGKPSTPLEEGEPPSYAYEQGEWLLDGPALVEHIEAARAIVRPRG